MSLAPSYLRSRSGMPSNFEFPPWVLCYLYLSLPWLAQCVCSDRLVRLEAATYARSLSIPAFPPPLKSTPHFYRLRISHAGPREQQAP